jgi:hypothetical protein
MRTRYHASFPRPRTWLVVLPGLAVCGCKGLTDVATPDVVQRGTLSNLQGVQALYTGAIQRFINAVSGQSPSSATGSLNHYVVTGLLSDELFEIATYNVAQFYDQRTLADPLPVSLNDNYRGYANLQGARVATLDVIDAARRLLPATSHMMGQLFALKAYTEIFFAEAYCSGIPLSNVEGFQVDYSPAVSRADMYKQASADLDSAAQYGKDTLPVLNLAKVGRARIALGRGDFAAAANAASDVPTSFVTQLVHVTPNRQNGLFGEMSPPLNSFSAVTVSDHEGGNGLDFVSSNDPRVAAAKVGTLNGYNWYRPGFLTSVTTPMVLASGTEARLAEAEAALQGQNVATWLATLNALRAGFNPPLSTLTDPGTTTSRVDLHFRERAFWLFLTGNRIADMRRLVRQYGRAIETVFPTGAYKPGLQYGTDANITAYLYERVYNPSYTGCINRGA